MPRRTISGRISAALPSRPTETGFALGMARLDHRDRLVDARGLLVEVAGAQAHLDAAWLAFDREAAGARHHRRERLRAAHAPSPAVSSQRPARAAAVCWRPISTEGFASALNDAWLPM